VEQYLSNSSGLPESSRWNQSGRGYPDSEHPRARATQTQTPPHTHTRVRASPLTHAPAVAAQSEGFVVVQDGIPMPFVGGTSCATPTASGIVALLNDLRLQKGLSTLGFLNPLLVRWRDASD
jgi:hypothetical protein